MSDQSTLRELAAALGRCSMLPGTAAKRAARHFAIMAKRGDTFTDRQAAYVCELGWRFRRQIAERLVDYARQHLPTCDASDVPELLYAGKLPGTLMEFR